MDRLLCYHVLLIFIAAIALSLLWVSFATPGWFVVTFQENAAQRGHTVSSLNRSLYYDVHCPQEYQSCRTCQAGEAEDCRMKLFMDRKLTEVSSTTVTTYVNDYMWVDSLIADKAEWPAWRAIMTVVVVCSLIGFIFTIVLVCCLLKPFTYRVVAVLGFVCWLVAGLLVWVPVGMVADMHVEVEDSINQDSVHDATLHEPYSVIIAAVGGFIALVAALLLLWLTGVCGDFVDYDTSSQSSVAIYSDQHKSRRIVREEPYFGAYPYYAPEVPDYDVDYRPGFVRRPPSEVVTVVQDYPYTAPATKWYENRY